jgi:hypothetical protein
MKIKWSIVYEVINYEYMEGQLSNWDCWWTLPKFVLIVACILSGFEIGNREGE